jgi:DNA-binding MarR family transcriptional regulator
MQSPETLRKAIMQPGKQLPRADHCYCFTVRKAARQISRFYDAHLQPTGLRITQFLILAMLDEVSSAAMLELAERLDIEPTAIGKMVRTLEREGLVSIRRSPTDARSRIVELTGKGHLQFDQAAPLWQEAQSRIADTNWRGKIDALRSGFALSEARPR